MTWHRLSDHAIASDTGHEIYRLPDGRFAVWGPPGSFGLAYGELVEASLHRELEALDLDVDGALGVTYRDARACLGVYEAAEEAKEACSDQALRDVRESV